MSMENKACRLCPRACLTDREKGDGRCHAGAGLRLARAALHYWEEPCISGREGSGAVFFSGCPLGCVYCQNKEIAQGAGLAISTGRLAQIFLELEDQGANNINLVTAGHYLPQVREALIRAKEEGLAIPVVYNSSGYETVEAIRSLAGLVDIFLPDLKYLDAGLAARYSNAPDYPEVAKAAIGCMVRQAGEPVFDERGMMRRGVIVRHLVLPGHKEEAKAVIAYLHAAYGDGIYISILNQYTPIPGVTERFPELSRAITRREYRAVVDYALEIGVENGFIQEGKTDKESFIPAFDFTGVRHSSREDVG